jgi:hypothetical protein
MLWTPHKQKWDTAAQPSRRYSMQWASWFFCGWLTGFLLACKPSHYHQTGLAAALPRCRYLIAADGTADSYEGWQHNKRVPEAQQTSRRRSVDVLPNPQQSSVPSLYTSISWSGSHDFRVDNVYHIRSRILSGHRDSIPWRTCLRRGKGTDAGVLVHTSAAIQDHAALRFL